MATVKVEFFANPGIRDVREYLPDVLRDNRLAIQGEITMIEVVQDGVRGTKYEFLTLKGNSNHLRYIRQSLQGVGVEVIQMFENISV